MQKLAAFIMAGRWQAVATVVAFAVLAMVIPPLIVISAAALVLVTARLGATAGLTVLGVATLLIGGIAWVATGQPLAGPLFALLQWLPVVVLALVLRYTVSLGLTLVAAIVIGLVALLIVYAIGPDLTVYWRDLLETYLRDPMVEAGMAEDEIEEVLARVARVMTGSVITSMLLVYVISVLLGRWWQGLLYNPDGFGQEFRALRLGVPAAVLAIGLFSAAMLSGTHLATELAVVGLSMFFFQGLAILHELSGRTGNPTLWLVGAYVVLLLALPQMLAALTALGVLDNFVDLRGRLPRRRSED